MGLVEEEELTKEMEKEWDETPKRGESQEQEAQFPEGGAVSCFSGHGQSN